LKTIVFAASSPEYTSSGGRGMENLRQGEKFSCTGKKMIKGNSALGLMHISVFTNLRRIRVLTNISRSMESVRNERGMEEAESHLKYQHRVYC
jgi:hypothetical protein